MEKQETSGIGAWRFWLYALAFVLLATGLYFVIGGAVLISRGGSWYFAIAGLVIVAAAVQMARALRARGFICWRWPGPCSGRWPKSGSTSGG